MNSKGKDMKGRKGRGKSSKQFEREDTDSPVPRPSRVPTLYCRPFSVAHNVKAKEYRCGELKSASHFQA